ncbi:MAG: VPLPA-CTERM sorting domain-containing protein [Gammaproteobacteria bacterium]
MKMKIVRRVLITLITWGALAQAASAATLSLVNTGTALARDGVYAGLYNISIDGKVTPAMCDDWNTEVPNHSWTATGYTYAEIINGAPVKFAGTAGLTGYKEAGWLFSQLPTVSQSDQADINLAVWKIMSNPTIQMNSTATTWYDRALGHSDFNFSHSMMVWTPNPRCASQEFLTPLTTPPSAVPLPAAVWLFGSGLVGLVAVGRRRHNPAA